MRGISRETSRGVDRHATEVLRIPSICLMENAARGAAEVALRLESGPDSVFLCLAGPGNNGGDALAVARHLAVAGRQVVVGILTSRSGALPGGDAGVQVEIVRAMALETHLLQGPDSGKKVRQLATRADLIVDGLFGTGLDRAIAGPAAGVVEAVNASGRSVLSLDVPSGLDCDTGRPLGACVRASATVTFVARKLGMRSLHRRLQVARNDANDRHLK